MGYSQIKTCNVDESYWNVPNVDLPFTKILLITKVECTNCELVKMVNIGIVYNSY